MISGMCAKRTRRARKMKIKLELDKIVHGLSCYAICTIAFFMLLLFAKPWVAFVASLVLGCVAGAGKELYDKYTPGHFASKEDLIADGIGIAVAAVLEVAVLVAAF